jgi:2-(1,2-epoxy-1,2-dihydrophenyl)acetyl-CoA isomerase
MSEPAVLAYVRDGIGTIRMNRSEERNALSIEMRAGFADSISRFEADPAVRCVVLSAAGDMFMAGANVKTFHASLTADREAYLAGIEDRVHMTHLFINRLHRMTKPVVASVQGGVVGFGLCLTLAADLAIASDDAYFMLAYRHIGLSPDAGASFLLPRVVGERRAMEITLLGDRFPAAQALDWGVVNRVVPRHKLEAETEAFARRLADGPTVALGRAKKLIRAAFETGWNAHLQAEAEHVAACMTTNDHLEGLTAFIEKRPCRFTGT